LIQERSQLLIKDNQFCPHFGSCFAMLQSHGNLEFKSAKQSDFENRIPVTPTPDGSGIVVFNVDQRA
jgi:hypothetical protein